MMPSINAACESGPVLFVFKGTRMPWGEVQCGTNTAVEILASHLPTNALVNIRQEMVSVDSASFLEFARHFTKFVRYLTAGERKVLLTYDAY